MADLAMERRTLCSKLRMFRFGSLVVGISNLGILLFGALLLTSIVSDCSNEVKLPFSFAPFLAGVKIMAMVGAGKAQHAAAEAIMSRSMGDSIAVDAVIRHERRVGCFCFVLFEMRLNFVLANLLRLRSEQVSLEIRSNAIIGMAISLILAILR
jgi:hypothetical protein